MNGDGGFGLGFGLGLRGHRMARNNTARAPQGARAVGRGVLTRRERADTRC